MNSNQLSDPKTWVDQYGDFLFRYAFSRARRKELAEELVQETLLAGLRSYDKFSGKSLERTWLVGILKHKIYDHFRKTFKERPVSEIQNTDRTEGDVFDAAGHWKNPPSKWESLDPDKMFEKKEFWEILNSCLSKLPHDMNHIFTLRELEQLSTTEICNMMNITTTNLGVILYRARNKLRECLGSNWFGKELGGKI